MSPIIWVRFRLVAATSRTSMGIVLVPPNLSNAFLLQSPEQFRLQIQGNVAHLVQKQSPPVRHLKTADLLRQGAGKGPSLVAEQLAFEKPGRNGGTVQA